MTTTSTPSTRHSFSDRLGPPRRRVLISLTPLIDVVFILLMFFMLASNFSNLHAIVLNAPAAAGGGAPSLEGALLVDVRRDGVRFAGRYVTVKQLLARVKAARADHPDRRVLVRPSAGVSLQDTVRILDVLSSAGVRNLRLMGNSS